MGYDTFSRNSDRKLAQRLASGDDRAFEELYYRYVNSLMRLAQHWLNPEDALEIVHDVLLDAISDIQTYDADRASLAAWLNVRCRYRAIDRTRQIYRRLRLVPISSSDLVGVMAINDPEHQAVTKSEIELLWATLSRQEREVVALHYFYGMPYDEIAERMQIAISTVKEYSKRARNKFRDSRSK